jgi:MFS family permease
MMRFAVKDTLTEQEIQSGLRSIIKDGLASQTMVTLTGGVFLVAFALQLGASNLVIGLLAAISPLAQLIQIPSIYLVEKYRVRRTICVFASASSRFFWLLIALIPFLFSIKAGLIALIVALALHAGFSAVSSSSWNPWMRDLVPQDRLGSFFSKRMSLAMTLGIPLSLVAGFYIDYWKRHYPEYELYSYSVLFFLGFLAGMLGVYFISTIPEPRLPPSEGKPKLFMSLFQPFKDENFRNLLTFMGSWNFAVNLAAPFFTVYMLRLLELDMSFIIVLLVGSQVTSIAFVQIWGRFSDRFSNKSVLGVSGPLFMLCILAWTFTTLPGKYFLTLPLLVAIHIFMGISTAGVTLASGNIGLKLAPKGQATAYLAANSLVNSIMAGIAPVFGGLFADFFAGRELAWTLTYTTPTGKLVIPTLDFQQWDFFFFLAFLIGVYSIHRLALVKEAGEVEEKLVLQELIAEVKRPLRNFSTAGELQQLVQFPFSILRTTFERAMVGETPRKSNKRKW